MPMRTHRFINFERTPFALASSLIQHSLHLQSHIDDLLTGGHITVDEYKVLIHHWVILCIHTDYVASQHLGNIHDLRRAVMRLCGYRGDHLRIAEHTIPAEIILRGGDWQIRKIISAHRLAHRLIDFSIRIPLYWQGRPDRHPDDDELTIERATIDQTAIVKNRCDPRCPYFRFHFGNLEAFVQRTMGSTNVPDVFTGEPPSIIRAIPNLFNSAPIEHLMQGCIDSTNRMLTAQIETARRTGTKNRAAPPAKLPFKPTEPAEEESLDGLLADIDQLTKGEPPDESST